MENIVFDTGVKEYRINGGGILRFNPRDPNLYVRFLEGLEKVKDLEEELIRQVKALEESENREENGAAVLGLMQKADEGIKAILTDIFGPENDFQQVLGGVNLLAIGGNGQRVITNLLAVLQPILVAGAESYASRQAEAAVSKAKKNRAKRAGNV